MPFSRQLSPYSQLPSSLVTFFIVSTSGLKPKTLEEKLLAFSSLNPFLSIRLKWSGPPGQRVPQLLGGGGGRLPLVWIFRLVMLSLDHRYWYRVRT